MFAVYSCSSSHQCCEEAICIGGRKYAFVSSHSLFVQISLYEMALHYPDRARERACASRAVLSAFFSTRCRCAKPHEPSFDALRTRARVCSATAPSSTSAVQLQTQAPTPPTLSSVAATCCRPSTASAGRPLVDRENRPLPTLISTSALTSSTYRTSVAQKLS